jgi:hypothetical protein
MNISLLRTCHQHLYDLMNFKFSRILDKSEVGVNGSRSQVSLTAIEFDTSTLLW